MIEKFFNWFRKKKDSTTRSGVIGLPVTVYEEIDWEKVVLVSIGILLLIMIATK